MPQLVKKRRSGWALLAVSALVASLFAVGASPAAAVDEDSKQDHKATETACLGPALADQGFTDLGTLEAAVPNINCLAYYGITAGRTADTFDPNSNVTRRHMALFLYAAAGLMGVDLMGGDMMADFGDISELGEGMQNAITALARNGIMSGRGDMAFEPFADITRAEMAVALVSLLDHTPGAPVHKNKAGLFILGDDAQTAQLPNDSFADAYVTQSQPVNNAISAAYELGITSGVGDGMFGPSGTVPRRDMATFIINALNFSNARPAGLTAQVANGTITASVRDADFAPVVNQTIDAFKTAVAFENKAFKDDGTCSSRTSLVDGATKCAVDGADPVTDSGGNSMLAQLTADVIGQGLTVWLWAGNIGDKFGSGTDYYEMSVVAADTPTPKASSSDFSTDVAKGATKVHFSATVTVTIQLQGTDGTDTVDVGPGGIGGESGIEYTVVINKRATANGQDPTTGTTVFDTRTIKTKVDASGAATFTVDATDSNPGSIGNRVMVDWTISGGDFSGNTPAGPDLTPDPATGNVIFSDETAVVTAISASVAPFQDAPGAGNPAGTAVTVTVTDQFGRPFKGAGIVIRSNNSASVLPTTARTTGSNGQVRIGYSYTGGASEEELTPTYVGPDGVFGGADDVTGTPTKAYWVSAFVDTGETNTKAAVILSANLDNDQIVYDPDGGDIDPTSVNYDTGDYFILDGAPATYEAFEEALGKGVEARNAALAAGNDPSEEFRILFTSYVFDDPSDIAQFTLTTKK